MIKTLQRQAWKIAILSLLINVVMTVIAIVLWVMAIYFGWLKSVVFVSNVSMLALLFAGVAGTAAALAGILTLIPTDDVVDKVIADD